MWKSRLVLLLLLVAAVRVQAMTVFPIDVAKQVDEADLIFIGTVVDDQSVPVKDRTFAFTYVTFLVEETLKGSVDGGAVTLRFAGGKAGPVRYSIGAPKFENGGRHLLFVVGNERYFIPLSGAPQGKLNLVRHPETQEELLTDDDGRLIGGLRELNWVRSGLVIDMGGQLQRPERVAEVVSQEGVTVVLDQPDPDAEPVPASQVLGELRALIQSRAFGPAFKRSGTVQSASPANVPTTDPHRIAMQPEAQ